MSNVLDIEGELTKDDLKESLFHQKRIKILVKNLQERFRVEIEFFEIKRSRDQWNFKAFVYKNDWPMKIGSGSFLMKENDEALSNIFLFVF